MNKKTLILFVSSMIILSIITWVIKNKNKIYIVNTPKSGIVAENQPNFISPGISWKVTPDSLFPSEQKDIPAIQTAIINAFANTGSKQYLSIEFIEVSESKWLKAQGGLYYTTTNKIVPTEGVKLYGEKLSTGWKIYSSGDTDFCDYTKRAPKDWVDAFYLENDCK